MTACVRSGCGGQVVDGFCDACGLAPPRESRVGAAPPVGPRTEVVSSRRPPGSRPTRSTRTVPTDPARFGSGLVDIPPVVVPDPATVVLADPSVAEDRRYCSSCDAPVGRGRDGAPGRTSGYCRSCGHPFSFVPKLQPGELVGGQYEVVGCLAHGGLGWIYLARDRRVSDRWVALKGLLNTADHDALAAALAERRFLAEVKHPNIVKIYNFVEHDDDGYIVMEFVGGPSLRTVLEQRRAERGGAADPLPVAHALAYVLEVLPALAYLHGRGLLFCDLKPDNLIRTETSIVLIDLGGVHRLDDDSADIWGTVGYQAPEVAVTGPTVASDVFTVGRTLAVLCTDFRGFQTTYATTLPPREGVPVYEQYESLYRVIERATALDPDERFGSVQELGDQLAGVLREVVAHERGTPVPGASRVFGTERPGTTTAPDWHAVPVPLPVSDDASAAYLTTVVPGSPGELDLLRAAPEPTAQVRLRVVQALLAAGRADEATDELDALAAADPFEWRADWFRGLAALARDDLASARACFASVHRAVPGELAPRLALAQCAERLGDHEAAARWYDVVSRTDSAMPSAAFGLARCRLAQGRRHDASAALGRVPDTSSLHADALAMSVDALLGPATDAPVAPADVHTAAGVVEQLAVDAGTRARLEVLVFGEALRLLADGSLPARPDVMLLGRPTTEREVRLGLEHAYRTLARHAGDAGRRIELVDLANRVRPRTLV